MTSIILYMAPSTCARVPLIALEEIGVPYEGRLVRFMRGEHRSAEFRALNPKGKVPALVIDGDALTENVAILNYLADRYPEARLLPPASDNLARGRRLADLCFCSATLHPIVTRIRIPTMFADGAEAQKSVYLKAVEMMDFNFGIIEQRVAGGRWWYGEDWSIMDAYLYWVWFRVTGANFPGGAYPGFSDHAARMERRPAVQRALAAEAAAQQQLEAEGMAFRPPPPPV